MDFYNKRKRAAIDIDTELENKKSIEIPRMCLLISSRYGLSNKFVKERVELLIEGGLAEYSKVDKNFVLKLKEEKKK